MRTVYPAHVRHGTSWRGIGSTLLALGGASIVAWGRRRRHTDRVLLWFGVWCSLYGLRLLVEQPSVVQAVGGSLETWRYVHAFVTYAISVPIGLFLESLIGTGWRQSVRRVWQAPYKNGGVDLRHGDAILVCTDGLPETQNARGDFLDLARDWLTSTDSGNAAQCADSMMRKPGEWRGGSTFEDDVTLVIAQVQEPASIIP
jgi:hypothetical protein